MKLILQIYTNSCFSIKTVKYKYMSPNFLPALA